jgi:hypothetical protein
MPEPQILWQEIFFRQERLDGSQAGKKKELTHDEKETMQGGKTIIIAELLWIKKIVERQVEQVPLPDVIGNCFSNYTRALECISKNLRAVGCQNCLC